MSKHRLKMEAGIYGGTREGRERRRKNSKKKEKRPLSSSLFDDFYSGN